MTTALDELLNPRSLFNPEGEGDGDGGEGTGDTGGDAGGGDSGGDGGSTGSALSDGRRNSGDGGTDDGAGKQGDAQGGGQDQGTELTLDKWREALPKELQQDRNLQKFGTVDELARGYVNAQKMIGRSPDSLIELPSAEDDGTQRREVLQKLGLPEDTQGYKLEAPENAPEGYTPDGELAKEFVGKAHELGILPDQANALFQWYGQKTGEAVQAQQGNTEQQAQQNIAKLQEEWGNAYQQRVAAANFAIDKIDPSPESEDSLLNKLNNAGLGSDPTVLKALANVGMMYREDTAGTEGGGKRDFGTTPNEARSKGQELLEKALNTKNPAEARRLNEEAQKWFKQASAA